LNYQPLWSFEDGLIESVQWYINNLKESKWWEKFI
jgi:dTDP-D-glucose 4,6-dehydratase